MWKSAKRLKVRCWGKGLCEIVWLWWDVRTEELTDWGQAAANRAVFGWELDWWRHRCWLAWQVDNIFTRSKHRNIAKVDKNWELRRKTHGPHSSSRQILEIVVVSLNISQWILEIGTEIGKFWKPWRASVNYSRRILIDTSHILSLVWDGYLAVYTQTVSLLWSNSLPIGWSDHVTRARSQSAPGIPAGVHALVTSWLSRVWNARECTRSVHQTSKNELITHDTGQIQKQKSLKLFV